MTGFMEILDAVYSELSLSELISRNPSNEEGINKKFKEIWRIDTEVEVGDFQKDVEILIGFDELFPYKIPRAYLSIKSFLEIYPIPHLDKDKFICTFHDDNTVLDTDRPAEIVEIVLREAKKIIREGLESTNADDFKDELKAYWTDTDESDSWSCLSLLTEFPKKNTRLKIYKLSHPFNSIRSIIYHDEEDPIVKSFINYLKSKGYRGNEIEGLFLSDFKLELKLPFPEKNGDILKTLGDSSLVVYKEYINSGFSDKVIFFTAETLHSPVLLGWKHKPLITKRRGYRHNYFTSFKVLSTIQKGDRIKRISVNEYSNHRVENRTSGVSQNKYTFLIAGLGSIGSNLVYFLNAFNYPNFKLIDHDFFKIENIGRHLLGFGSVNTFKAESIRAYLNDIRPDQNVLLEKTTIEAVTANNIKFINDCTCVFIAIGNQNIESFMLKKQIEGLITVPMFYFWVEPYALGAHCLFLHPDNQVKPEDLYEDHFYRYNVISIDEYKNKNPVLTKREAGCQTSYTPYSGNDVVMFLSSIYKWMNDVIKEDKNESTGIQWTGNIEYAAEIGIRVADNYVDNKPYTYKIFSLKNESQDR